jgi:hypothetical protein
MLGLAYASSRPGARGQRTGNVVLLALLPLLYVSSLGCAQSDPGALEQAGFAAACSDDDVGCVELGLTAPLAVGATLSVDLVALGAGQALPAAVLESARPEALEVRGTELVPLAPGVTALLLSAEDGGVIDFFHVASEAPDALAFVRADDPRRIETAIQLLVGDELVLVAAPSRAGQRLAGEVEAEWSVGASETVALLTTGQSGERRLVARAPGTATVQVAALGLSSSLVLEVLP